MNQEVAKAAYRLHKELFRHENQGLRFCDNAPDVKAVLKRLNELEEENEALRAQVQRLEQDVDLLSASTGNPND